MSADDRVSTKIVVPGAHSMVSLLGSRDELLMVIEKALASDIHVRGNEITVTGAAADNALAVQLFEELLSLLERGQQLSGDAVQRSIAMLQSAEPDRPADVLTLNIVSSRGRTIRPKTVNQKRYVEAIDRHTVVFGIGPAGTGKTYLAMAKAVQSLQAKQVNRIILTRPAVEAGERLGFLPGTLYEKIDPYLRPLYDALHDMLDPEMIPKLMAAGTIEVAPLAYMRGRAQPVDTPVLTPEGYRPLGSLDVGDLVYGSDGLPTPVLGVYPQGRKEVFRLRTRDGAETLACGEHLWWVTTRRDRRQGRAGRVVRTADLIGRLRRGLFRDVELPIVAPVELPATPVLMDPYALGRRLGSGDGDGDGDRDRDGGSGSGSGSGSDGGGAGATTPTLTTLMRRTEDGRGGVAVVPVVAGALPADERDGTTSPTRGVPPEYLLNALEVRLALLQGLLDSASGSLLPAGRTCRIRYSTGSDDLRRQVVWLVRSLGGVADVRTGRVAGSGPAGPGPVEPAAHVIDIRLPAGIEPFRSAANRDRYDRARGRRPARFVDAIEPAGESDCVCISVGAANSLYVTTDFLVTHNTLNDAFIILDEAQNTSAEQMKMFLTRLGFGSKIVVTGDVTQVDLPSGTASGLRIVRDILEGVEDVHFAHLESADVVRHKLVSRIVDAYALYDDEQQAARGPAGRGAPRPPGRRDDVKRSR